MLLLRTNILIHQWTSFVILIAGMIVIQLRAENKVSSDEQNHIIGVCAVLGACILSGFTGTFVEKMFKKEGISIWMRNIQMSLLSIPIGMATCLLSNFNDIRSKGFFHGFDWFVVYIVVLQAFSGLLVAVVMKYAGNILKGFAIAFTVIITSIASKFLFDFQFTIQFGIGTLLVIGATFLYSYTPKAKDTDAPVGNAGTLDENKDASGGNKDASCGNEDAPGGNTDQTTKEKEPESKIENAGKDNITYVIDLEQM